uniref:Uncharacterized protein n=1 Tax=Rhizophora mucronata TaxID=61149 RepID=A0A2P2NPB0_RHIMU
MQLPKYKSIWWQQILCMSQPNEIRMVPRHQIMPI